METYRTITTENKKLEIYYDDDSTNPRIYFDNLFTMFCSHKRYDLGDKVDIDTDDFNDWAEVEKYIRKQYNIAIIQPLYLYDHSGITISTSPFSCNWDSGQIGFIFVTKETLRKEYNTKNVTKKIIDMALNVLENEVELYDNYLTGNVYGFKEFKDNEEVNSCWGFFGSDFKKNGMAEYIEDNRLIELL